MISREKCEPVDIVIQETAKRKGEKSCEELLTEDDTEHVKDSSTYLVIDPNNPEAGEPQAQARKSIALRYASQVGLI